MSANQGYKDNQYHTFNMMLHELDNEFKGLCLKDDIIIITLLNSLFMIIISLSLDFYN